MSVLIWLVVGMVLETFLHVGEKIVTFVKSKL